MRTQNTLAARPTAAIRHLLILVIFKIELSDHNLDVRLGGSLQQLLQPHQTWQRKCNPLWALVGVLSNIVGTLIILIQYGEAPPSETFYKITVSL